MMTMAAALMMKKALLLEKKRKIPSAIAFFSLLKIQQRHPK
jgi:hypothetical protein